MTLSQTSLLVCKRFAFDSFSSIRKLLKVCSTTPGTTSAVCGVKLPKIDVPSFDGDILQWRQFWEQFCISMHDRTNLTNAEKMVYMYLRQSLKHGPARSIIKGLAHSGEQYEEAITSRYDRPRLVHQAHVRMILESPQLREGSGKELRRLHDTLQLHTRALKSMGKEPSLSFITFIVELKLDTGTMFEWQRLTQSDTDLIKRSWNSSTIEPRPLKLPLFLNQGSSLRIVQIIRIPRSIILQAIQNLFPLTPVLITL